MEKNDRTGNEELKLNSFSTPINLNTLPEVILEDRQVRMKEEVSKTPMQIAVEQIKIFSDNLKLMKEIDFKLEKFGDEVIEMREELKNATSAATRRDVEARLKQLSVTSDEQIVILVNHLFQICQGERSGIGFWNNGNYIFDKYWRLVDEEVMKKFLEMIAIKSGINQIHAQQPLFRKKLYEQYMAIFEMVISPKKDVILINFPEGTFEFEFRKQKKGRIREFRKEDYLFDCREFNYNPEIKTTQYFQTFLDRVLPDKKCQMILLEFMGYIFASALNLQICLILFGSKGANGKSLLRTIIERLVGEQNICGYTLQNLCDSNEYYRAELANKLVCYPDEIGTGKYDPDIWKALVTGGTIGVRSPYSKPFMLQNTCKFIFNTNNLPVAQISNAFFRRMIILSFDVSIPKEEQDPFLAEKICETDLPAIFNMAMEGLERLIVNNQFTKSDICDSILAKYRKDSDSVATFLAEENWIPSSINSMLLKDFYKLYKQYCLDYGYSNICSSRTFSERLRNLNYTVKSGTNHYTYVGCSKKQFIETKEQFDVKSILESLERKESNN